MKAKNLVEWAKLVIERDNHTCQRCGAKDDTHIRVEGNTFFQPKNYTDKLVAHHKKEAKIYLKLRLEVNNGITLCRQCHGLEPRQRILFYDVARLGKFYSRDGWAIPTSIRKRAKIK